MEDDSDQATKKASKGLSTEPAGKSQLRASIKDDLRMPMTGAARTPQLKIRSGIATHPINNSRSNGLEPNV
jgi:hypothetical protein